MWAIAASTSSTTATLSLHVKILGVKSPRPQRCAIDDGGGVRVRMQLHRGQPAAAAVATRRCASIGKNCAPRPGGTSSASALQTLGRLVLAFSTISTAIARSAALSHIDMADAGAGLDAGHGGILDTGADQPGPAAGISRSTSHRRSSARWHWRGMYLQSGSGALRQAGLAQTARSASTMAWQLAQASRPQRSTQALPALRASAAASLVTLGRSHR